MVKCGTSNFKCAKSSQNVLNDRYRKWRKVEYLQREALAPVRTCIHGNASSSSCSTCTRTSILAHAGPAEAVGAALLRVSFNCSPFVKVKVKVTLKSPTLHFQFLCK